jgi:hypothetical protein
MSGRRAAEVQKLYLSGTRKKRRCSIRSCIEDVIGKTRAGKFDQPRLHFRPAPGAQFDVGGTVDSDAPAHGS